MSATKDAHQDVTRPEELGSGRQKAECPLQAGVVRESFLEKEGFGLGLEKNWGHCLLTTYSVLDPELNTGYALIP